MKSNENNKKIQARSMPFNKEAEQCVLGSCLIDGEIVADVVSSLSEKDFYLPAHKRIFSAVFELYNDGKAADVVTITDILDRGGILADIGGLDYLIGLSEAIPSAANFRYYAGIVKRDSTLRELIAVSNSIALDAYD
ncbi:MAG: replicative DNA helicase, partial [Clostridiales bacterium]|nr:replicative DNA helicase [Clostridiales bacterium]